MYFLSGKTVIVDPQVSIQKAVITGVKVFITEDIMPRFVA
jgi:hypothetical protein